jgi:hypothetical protein
MGGLLTEVFYATNWRDRKSGSTETQGSPRKPTGAW